MTGTTTTISPESGIGLLEAMVGLAVLCTIVIATNGYMAKVAQENAVLNRRQEVELVRQFLEREFDCEQTFKNLNPSNCGVPGRYVDGYAEDGTKLATSDQSALLRDTSFRLRVSCPKNDRELFIEAKRFSAADPSAPALHPLTKEPTGWVDPFNGLSPFVSYGMKRPDVDFEQIPGIREGMSIESRNDYFKAVHGIWFKSVAGGRLNVVRIATDGGADPAVKGWHSIRCNTKKPKFNLLCNGGNGGRWIMSTTDALDTRSIVFEVHYLVPVKELSFDLADIDGGESYTVTAYDSAGKVVPSSTIPSVIHDKGYGPGTGNNALTRVTLKSTKRTIDHIRIAGRKGIKEYGFGFDNFSTGIAACHGW